MKFDLSYSPESIERASCSAAYALKPFFAEGLRKPCGR